MTITDKMYQNLKKFVIALTAANAILWPYVGWQYLRPTDARATPGASASPHPNPTAVAVPSESESDWLFVPHRDPLPPVEADPEPEAEPAQEREEEPSVSDLSEPQ